MLLVDSVDRNGQCGIEPRSIAIFLSADYKGVAPEPSGILRATLPGRRTFGSRELPEKALRLVWIRCSIHRLLLARLFSS